jgi:hypothetical protein
MDVRKKMKVKIVTIAKNEEKYLEEWLKYHFSLGVNEIELYDNRWEWRTKECR